MAATLKALDDNAISPVAKFLNARIEELKMQGISQRDIAREIGYAKPNILSMMKNGETKVPVDKVPAFARALQCDPVELYRMAMEQYWPNEPELLKLVSDNSATENEKEILRFIRELSGKSDPKLTDKLKEKLKEALSS